MIITIDGAAGTGKSTVAKKVADSLTIAYFDTGAMYRAFAHHVLQAKIDPSDKNSVIKAIANFNFTFHGHGSHKIYYVNQQDVTHSLRTPAVTEVSSIISQYSEVRSAMHKIQKDFATLHDAVFEGRDLGTVIFPLAEYKFFLKASDAVRAQRRFEEMKHKGLSVTFEEVLASIKQRDQRDEGRKIAPLKCAQDAFVIDTSSLSIDEVVGVILQKIKDAR